MAAWWPRRPCSKNRAKTAPQPHERTEKRQGYRNGYKSRKMKTRLGELLLSVPQARGVEPFDPYPLVKWQRSERAVLVVAGINEEAARAPKTAVHAPPRAQAPNHTTTAA